MLRGCLIAYGILCVVIGLVLLAVVHSGIVIGTYCLVAGCGLIAVLVFERRRYQPRVNRSRGRWQVTDERFVDPTTGHMMEVRFNPDTGERDYIDITETP
jgi:hypothetical protein